MSYNLFSLYDGKALVRRPLLFFLCIAIMLPYQIGVVQLQPIVTALLLLYVGSKLFSSEIRTPASYFYLLSIFFVITLYSSAISILFFSPDKLIKLISGLHNHIFLFLVMFALASTSIEKVDIEGEINFITKLLILLITINFITQMMQIFVPNYGNEVLLFFNSSFTTDKPTFQFAQALGRYSGFFNVSAVAGYFSIMGFIFLIHQFSKLSWSYKLSLYIIFTSGLLTLSKVFILGMAILIIVLCIYRQTKILSFIFLVGFLDFLLIIVYGHTPYLAKFTSYLNFIFNVGLDKQLSLRYGAVSHNSELVSVQSMSNLLFGQGFPTTNSIDSGPLWYMLQGGVFGLFSVGLFFLIWLLAIKKAVSKQDRVFIVLAYLITLITFLADPINVMRRSSVLFALIVYYTIYLSKTYVKLRTISYQQASFEAPCLNGRSNLMDKL